MKDRMTAGSKQKDDKPWTKKELMLRPGFVELAKAIVEQWHKDGCPVTDKEGIQFWQEIIDTWNT